MPHKVDKINHLFNTWHTSNTGTEPRNSPQKKTPGCVSGGVHIQGDHNTVQIIIGIDDDEEEDEPARSLNGVAPAFKRHIKGRGSMAPDSQTSCRERLVQAIRRAVSQTWSSCIIRPIARSGHIISCCLSVLNPYNRASTSRPFPGHSIISRLSQLWCRLTGNASLSGRGEAHSRNHWITTALAVGSCPTGS